MNEKKEGFFKKLFGGKDKSCCKMTICEIDEESGDGSVEASDCQSDSCCASNSCCASDDRVVSDSCCASNDS